LVAAVRFLDENRRTHPRTPFAAAAPGPARHSVAYVSTNRVLIARFGDLSASGMFLHTNFPDPVGTRATLDFDLDGQNVVVEAEVVRVSFDGGRDGTKSGMGLCFVDVPVALRRRLLQRVE
jgi:hypothetical protein